MLSGNIKRLSYNKAPILTDISCTIEYGRITSFIGKSGSGKTTLLRCLAGLEKTYEGLVTLDGNDIGTFEAQQRAEALGFVAQNVYLFPQLTAIQNCVQPLRVVKNVPKDVAVDKAFTVLKSLGMETFADNYPGQLSGGQQQRVALARALCLEPKILLLDEPTSALDPENTAIVAQLLKRLTEQGIGIGVSSQDTGFIRSIMDRVYLIEAGSITAQLDKKVCNQMNENIPISVFLKNVT